MFTFRVVVSTIIVFMMALLIYAGAKSEKSGKYMCWVMIIVYILCFMAMWGG